MNLNSNVETERYNKIKSRLDELKEIIDSNEEKDYVANCTYEIYSELLENNQFSDENPMHFIIEDRLIRCYRYIPSSYLDFYNIKKIVIGGLFIKVKICIMPAKNVVDCINSNYHGAILNPEEFGLPSGKEVDYGTSRIVNSRIATAIVSGTPISDWITRNYQYEYVTLS